MRSAKWTRRCKRRKPPWPAIRTTSPRGSTAQRFWRGSVAEVLRLVPYFNLRRARDWLMSQDDAFVSEYIEGLRLAGLPE